MRTAVISDIHGNYDAFEQVLVDIDRARIDHIHCLGDNIGYGPEPEEVVHRIRSLEIPSVIGNHELAVREPHHLESFNPRAKSSVLQTIELLSPETIQFIADLEPARVEGVCRFVHGFPPDSPLTYLFQISEKKLRGVFARLAETICFVGHTHELEMIGYDGNRVVSRSIRKGVHPITAGDQYIINVGSVGQPRDGSNPAKYVIWDSTDGTIEVRYVPYDIDKVAQKIIAAGFPKSHAMRLY